jgi:hypothetical protein
MKHYHGLESLRQPDQDRDTVHQFAQRLLSALHDCRCQIYGCIADDDRILLAELQLEPDTLHYDQFDQRIDCRVSGPIRRADCVPLTYHLFGNGFGISGRCSMIAKVCGVDLYLQRSYTGIVGDIAAQKFSIAVKPLLNLL